MGSKFSRVPMTPGSTQNSGNFSDVNTELIDEMKQEMDNGNMKDAKAIANDIRENENINHHGKRADAIVKGMLQHSRTSTGQKEPTDIRDVN